MTSANMSSANKKFDMKNTIKNTIKNRKFVTKIKIPE